jgi:hypothetical protein
VDVVLIVVLSPEPDIRKMITLAMMIASFCDLGPREDKHRR